MRKKPVLMLMSMSLVLVASSCAAAPKVELVQGKDKVDVKIGGKLFTSYLYSLTLTKPSLWPLHSPSGGVMTRSFPFVKNVPNEKTDHPHHMGVFFTYDEVNNDGFWNNSTFPPQVKHAKIKKMESGEKGTLAAELHWVGKSGETLLKENRTMVFSAGENQYIIDFDLTLTAANGPVVFGDTKEGMFAVRVAPFLKEKGGSGEYLSSNGDKKEKNVWGKRAKWVRLQGKQDDKTLGIAILNHPKSTNYPTYWHARGYGLFAANPLGQFAFQKGRKEENPKPFRLTLQSGNSAAFKFRMVVYEGDRSAEQWEKQYKKWAAVK
jgi:methane monooxygenase PmoA-like